MEQKMEKKQVKKETKKQIVKTHEKSKSLEKTAGFVSKNKIFLVTIVAVIVVGIVGFAIYKKLENEKIAEDLSVIEKAEFALLDGTSNLSDEELKPYYENTLDAVEPYSTKRGIVGLRANMLKAEVLFRQKNFDAARNAYESAAKKAGKSYLASINYFNAGVASEELNDTNKALEYYTIAANDKEFADPTRALFSIGRIKELTLDYLGAKEAYLEITAKNNLEDPWNSLAKVRLIAMQNDGKIE